MLNNIKYIRQINKFNQLNFNAKMCTIALGQMTSTNNKENNFLQVQKIINMAKQVGAKMVFLPEACDYIAENKTEALALAEPLSGPLMKQYKNIAKNHNLWLSLGGIHELIEMDGNKKIHNAHVIIDDLGEVVSVYRKIHMFNVYLPEENIKLMESDTTLAGRHIIPPVKTPAGLLGLSICYDLRFPELNTVLRQSGAEVLTYPSAFTHATGAVHWQTLLQARAIESQCYVIAAAQIGTHNSKRISHGQSLVVDPWGKVVIECEKYSEERSTYEPTICYTDIDLSKVDNIRKKMPILDHRRSDVYGCIRDCAVFSPTCLNEYTFGDIKIPPSIVFYSTNLSYAFTNLRCVVPGHVLVATLRQTRRLNNLTPIEISDLFKVVVKVQEVLEKVYDASSSTITIQDGEDAGQTVKHVHVHVMPRVKGDFPENDEIYVKMAEHDRGSKTVPPRDINEMIEEAQKLKQHFL